AGPAPPGMGGPPPRPCSVARRLVAISQTPAARTAIRDHTARPVRQPQIAATGAVRAAVRAAPPVRAAVYIPVTVPARAGNALFTTTGSRMLPTVMAAPTTKVPASRTAGPS